jgi:uncharacterized protein with von Willebrand factor type A (vWA) domain
MFLPFFKNLRAARVPVSLREFLAFLEGMKAGLATYDVDAFYFLARTTMVKDERHIDRFDQAFTAAWDDEVEPLVHAGHCGDAFAVGERDELDRVLGKARLLQPARHGAGDGAGSAAIVSR